METTIKLDKIIKNRLDSFKIHSRESYNDVITRIMENQHAKVDEESLRETIEVLSDPVAMRNISEALGEINKGNYGTSLDEFKKELRL